MVHTPVHTWHVASSAVVLFEFEERDYEPIDRFRLLWRWTSPGHAELPRHVLDQIHPLTATNAALVNEYIVARTRRGYPGLADRAEFRDNHRQHDVPDGNDSSTSTWLEALPMPAGESVIVCWDSQTAVAVPFGLVTRY